MVQTASGWPVTPRMCSGRRPRARTGRRSCDASPRSRRGRRPRAAIVAAWVSRPGSDGGRGNEQPEASADREESGEGSDQGAIGPAHPRAGRPLPRTSRPTTSCQTVSIRSSSAPCCRPSSRGSEAPLTEGACTPTPHPATTSRSHRTADRPAATRPRPSTGPADHQHRRRGAFRLQPLVSVSAAVLSNSSATTGSSPSTHASCPGSIR
jgi:hypothetical protein